MRITELLEGKEFNDLEFVKQDGDKRTIDYDLVEDLVYFMNNDDDVYRRTVYPAVAKCVESLKAKRKTTPQLFKGAVIESYKQYIKKFPVRDLPDQLEPELFKETCEKLYDDICDQYSEGNYKD